MSDIEFPKGIGFKAPHQNAPEYVKAKVSIKREELIAWLQSKQGDWINLDVKVSQNGKWYAAVDNWKPKQASSYQSAKPPVQGCPQPERDDFQDSDLPF